MPLALTEGVRERERWCMASKYLALATRRVESPSPELEEQSFGLGAL